MPESVDKIIGRLEGTVGGLITAVSDLKKEFEGVSKKLDDLAIEWQKFGGLYNNVNSLSSRVDIIESENKKFDIEYGSMLSDIREERKDNKYQARGLVWEIIKMFVIAILAGGGATLGIKFFDK